MVETLEYNGVPPADAEVDRFVTPGNARWILGLYRSAVDIGQAWAPDIVRIVIWSMILWSEQNLVVPIEIGRRMAADGG